MKLIAYQIHADNPMPIIPAPVQRPWMDDTPDRFAYRCLPVVLASQAGWWVMCTHTLKAQWDGHDDIGGLKVIPLSGTGPCPASSHFGCGILTFTLPYLFRTEPGWDLMVKGPANWIKDGIAALEGLVHADTAYQTFTMNWRMTRPGHVVHFMAGEPVCQILPVRRGELERVEPELLPIGQDAELLQKYRHWSQRRDAFNIALLHNDPQASMMGWQKHYFHESEQRKMDLKPFRSSK